MKQKNKNKGITLIALVITIIILLILAGVTIGQLTGNGLFEKVKLAKEKSEQAKELENTTLSEYEKVIDESSRNNNSDKTLDGYIKPSGTKQITANGEYDISQYEKVNVNVPQTEIDNDYTNKNYIQDGLSIYDNRITIIDGGYYTDNDGTTFVNITFKTNIALTKDGIWLLIEGIPSIDGTFVVTDINRQHAFYIGTSNGRSNAINFFDRGRTGISANETITLQFKYKSNN